MITTGLITGLCGAIAIGIGGIRRHTTRTSIDLLIVVYMFKIDWMNFHRLIDRGIHVQNRLDEYKKSIMNNCVITNNEEVTIMVSWKPLEREWFKLNTYRACMNGGMAGCGGIIRDSSGKCKG